VCVPPGSRAAAIAQPEVVAERADFRRLARRCGCQVAQSSPDRWGHQAHPQRRDGSPQDHRGAGLRGSGFRELGSAYSGRVEPEAEVPFVEPERMGPCGAWFLEGDQIKTRKLLTLSSERLSFALEGQSFALRLVVSNGAKKGAREGLGEFLMQLAIALPQQPWGRAKEGSEQGWSGR